MQFLLVLGLLFIIWILPIILGINLSKKRNRSPHWMWFGIYPIVGWIILIIIFCLPPLKKCQSCNKRVQADAILCPYCGVTYPENTIIKKKELTKKKRVIRTLCIISIICAFIVLMFCTMNAAFVNSLPYQKGLELTKSNIQVQNLIGNNIHKNGFITGSLSTNGSMSGSADFAFKIAGSKGKARLYIVANKENGEWTLTKLLFFPVGNKSDSIDLLEN